MLNNQQGLKQWGVLALVGGALGSLLHRAVTPFIAGAVIYVLGYWVRGRPETPKLLAAVTQWRPTFPGSAVFVRQVQSAAGGQPVTQVANANDGNIRVLSAEEVEAMTAHAPAVQTPVPSDAGPVGTASGETYTGATNEAYTSEAYTNGLGHW